MRGGPTRSAGTCWLLCLALVGCGQVEPETTRQFQQAEELFRSAQSPADYLRVAAIYQEILDGGTVSGVVLYNQGNAFVKAGEPARAIAAYRQAQRYRPQDPYLAANLSHALAQSGHSPSKPTRSIAEMILFWQNWIGYDDKFHLVTALAALTILVAVLSQFFPNRRLGKRLALAGLTLTVLFAVSAGYDWLRFERTRHGVVVADEIVARKGDSTNYDPAFNEPLTEGAEFVLLERRNDWLSVRMTGVGTGWIPATAAVTY